jgi:hypothetical protein
VANIYNSTATGDTASARVLELKMNVGEALVQSTGVTHELSSVNTNSGTALIQDTGWEDCQTNSAEDYMGFKIEHITSDATNQAHVDSVMLEARYVES